MAITDKYVSSTATGSGDGSSEASPWTLAQAVSNLAAGQRVNIKKGVYTLTSVLNPSAHGTAYRPVLWRGYDTTPGDLDDKLTSKISGTLSDSMPVIETSYSYYALLDSDMTHLIGLCFKNTSGNRPALYDRSRYGWRKNCIFIQDVANSTFAAIRIDNTQYRTYLNCEFRAKGDASNSSRYAVNIGQLGCEFHYCYFNANGVSSSTTNGLVNVGYRCQLFNKCVFDGGSTQIKSNDESYSVVDCVFHNAGDDAINVTGNSSFGNSFTNGISVVNCYFSEVGGYAIGNPSPGSLGLATSGIGVFNNAYYNVTNKFEHMPDTQEYDEVADTSAPFEDAPNGNFALVSGSNARGYGMGNQISLASEGSSDVGAIQHTPVVDTSQPQEAGTQVSAFGQWAITKPEASLHPLRSS